MKEKINTTGFTFTKILKYIIIIPLYVLLLLWGFVGGADSKDIWDNLVKWVKN